MFFRRKKEASHGYDPQKFKSLNYFPHQELYRLVVDGDFHGTQKGWMGYESREPGCLTAFFDALQFINQNDGKPLTKEYIQTIHYLVDRFDTRRRKAAPGHFCDPTVTLAPRFAIYQETSSIAGLTEFLDDIESNQFLICFDNLQR